MRYVNLAPPSERLRPLYCSHPSQRIDPLDRKLMRVHSTLLSRGVQLYGTDKVVCVA